MSDLLALSGVSRGLRGFALEDISFSLASGYIMGLVGPNGSGKTTTIRLIMNMLRRDSGRITVVGIDNLEGETAAKKLIGYVPEENIFAEEWKASDVAKALKLYYETFDRERFAAYLHRFDLPPDRRIKDYSRGMKTKMMLASALSRETRLLLLDEPTSGLDPVVRSELLDILQDYISDGEHSVLFSTHVTTDLERIADYITFIHRGSVVFTRATDDVLSGYVIVKGRSDQLDEGVKRSTIGLRENATGFSGLMRRAEASSLRPAFVREEPTIDEIVIYHTLGRRQ